MKKPQLFLAILIFFGQTLLACPMNLPFPIKCSQWSITYQDDEIALNIYDKYTKGNC